VSWGQTLLMVFSQWGNGRIHRHSKWSGSRDIILQKIRSWRNFTDPLRSPFTIRLACNNWLEVTPIAHWWLRAIPRETAFGSFSLRDVKNMPVVSENVNTNHFIPCVVRDKWTVTAGVLLSHNIIVVTNHVVVMLSYCTEAFSFSFVWPLLRVTPSPYPLPALTPRLH